MCVLTHKSQGAAPSDTSVSNGIKYCDDWILKEEKLANVETVVRVETVTHVGVLYVYAVCACSSEKCCAPPQS